MQRVSVVGNSGSGKSTVARAIAGRLGVPYVELDAIQHLADWVPIDPDEFAARVTEVTERDGWVIDGNYRALVVDGPVWERADTAVWLDLPRKTVMRQVIWRTLRRLVRREELWNGNREPARNILSWDPDRSIIRWAWTQHDKYRQRYLAASQSPELGHIEFVRLESRSDADEWLDQLSADR